MTMKDKRIAELEDKLANADYQLESRDIKIKELEHQLTHRNCLDCSNHSSKLRMRNLELEKENAELKEFYENEYFQIADRTADEKIKELEKHQVEVTIDDYSPYNENTWGMMHEEWFVPKEAVRDLLKENYALITKAKEIIREFMKYEINEYDGSLEIHFEELKKQAEQFLKDLEK